MSLPNRTDSVVLSNARERFRTVGLVLKRWIQAVLYSLEFVTSAISVVKI
jgi:hypothetical protein